jgi:uncharacterized membrane protein YfcA
MIGHFLTGQRVPLEEALLFVIAGVIGFEIAMRVAHHISGAGFKADLFAAAILMMSIVMLVHFLLAG